MNLGLVDIWVWEQGKKEEEREQGKCNFRPCGRVGGIIWCREHPHANGYRGKYKETTTTLITIGIRRSTCCSL